MLKVDEIEFVKPVGGGWTVTSLTVGTRGHRYACECTDDEQTFFLSKIEQEKPVRTVKVARHMVAWWHTEDRHAAKR